MDWAALLSSLPHRREPPAFVYFAEVCAFVERSEYRLNPEMPFELLRNVLLPEPPWLRHTGVLSHPWPVAEPTSEDELVDLALLSCKTMLALGAQIPARSFAEMQEQFDVLFPAYAEARRAASPELFEAKKVHVVIDAVGCHQTWFLETAGRAGREIVIPGAAATFSGKPNTLTRSDVALRNLLRLDLQKHIEERAHRQSSRSGVC